MSYSPQAFTTATSANLGEIKIGSGFTIAGDGTVNNGGVTQLTGAATIKVSGATGSITLTDIGVLSIAGTTNQVTASASTGAVTLSLPQSIATTNDVRFQTLTTTNTLWAGGPINGYNGLTVTGGTTSLQGTSITSATSATNTQSGALQVVGGVGIGGGLYIGGNIDSASASPSIFSTPSGTITLGQNAGQMTIAQIAATIDIGGSIIGSQTVSLANSGNASLVNVNIAASVGNGNTRTIAIGANGNGAATVNLYLGSNSTASKTYINTTTAVASSTFSVNGSAGINGSVYVGGLLTVNSSLETYTSPAISANAVTLNFNNGNTFALASNAANITANYTNVTTATGQIIATALVITQGATAYIPSAVNINTVSQTILWQGGTPPTGNANKTDIVSFAFICNGTTTPTVIGSLSTYG